MTKISVILPSVFPDDVAHTIRSFHETTHTIDYEIVVVSPFEIAMPRVTWIRETTPLGCVPAHVEAFKHVTGDFVTASADDTVMRSNWDDLAMRNFVERERGHAHFSLGLQQSTRVINTVFGIYYPEFPLVRKSTLDALGYFSPEYAAHFTDSDLALRIWGAGGRCEFSREPLVKHMNLLYRDDNATKKWTSLMRDAEVFVRKWAPKYGAGWDTRDPSQFNLSVNALMQLTLVREQSIWFNDPRFKQLCDNFGRNIRECQATVDFPAA